MNCRNINNTALVVLLTAALSFSGCSGNKNKVFNTDQYQSDSLVQKDSTYLFNGINLDGWEITNFGPQGPVYVSGDKIILGLGDGCTGITWKNDFPTADYEISLNAMRMEGNDFFAGITFPVGSEFCSLIVGGWGGTTVGLSSINGMDASENETTRLMEFQKNQWYNISILVRENEIKAFIDSVLVVDFVKGDKKLSVRPEVGLSKPFGIASWTTTAAVRNIRVRRKDLKTK
jgi:hypothetical protein